MIWRIITGEYPPQPGGVSDYTRVVAHGLAAAGDRVEVWAPELPRDLRYDGAVELHPLADRFGPRALLRLTRALSRDSESRVLLQYVPQAFGLRGMNLPLCWWLAARSSSLRPLVMFHEVAFPIARSASLRRNFLGLVTRRMAAVTAHAAARVLVSTPVWSDVLREQCGFSGEATWLPLPGTIAPIRNEGAVLDLRRRYRAADSTLLGHFGGYPRMLRARLARLFGDVLKRHSQLSLLLLGATGRDFHDEFVGARPDLADRVFAPGALSADGLSFHLSACDLMLQLYPDGACARRTTMVTALAHGRPIVSAEGPATEPIWRQCRALALTPNGDGAVHSEIDALLHHPERRRALGEAAAALYRERFALEHTVRLLQELGCESR